MNLRVVLADDHPLFREAVKVLLKQARIDVTGEAADGREAVQLVRDLDPDVAALDLNMPFMNGIEAARELGRVASRTRVVLLTMFGEDRFVLEALRAGVRGYIVKEQAACDLVAAIRQVARGTIYLSPHVSNTVVAALTRAPPSDPLSERERQVLRLVAEGLTTRDIASTLGLSTRAAVAHRNRIMRKLDIRATAGLVRYAVQHGLVKP